MTRRKSSDKDIERQVIAHAATRFEEDGNPLDAWQAIGFALAGGLPLPPSVHAYLLDVANKIELLAPSAGSVDREVATALGLQGKQGGGSAFERSDRWVHEHMIAFAVWLRDRQQPADAKLIETFVAVGNEHPENCPTCKKCLPWKTVERAWYNHAREIIPADLQQQFPDATPAEILKSLRPR